MKKKNKGFVLVMTVVIFTFIFMILSTILLITTNDARNAGIKLLKLERRMAIEQIAEDYIIYRDDFYDIYLAKEEFDADESTDSVKRLIGEYKIELYTQENIIRVYNLADKMLLDAKFDFANKKIIEWKYYE